MYYGLDRRSIPCYTTARMHEQPQPTHQETKMQAYCVKCKAKRFMVNAQTVKMANGHPAAKGKCPICGTGMYKILPRK